LRLTTRAVESATCPEGKDRQTYRDGAVPGLSLRVTPEGVRTFALFYRISGRARLYTVGRFPAVSLHEARQRAKDVLAAARRGIDAEAVKVQAREALSFLEVAEKFVEARADDLARSTATEYRRMVTAYLRPSPLASVPAAEVRRGALREMLVSVARNSGPVMANRLFQLVRAVCRWAHREEVLAVNPADGLQRPRKERTRERTLSDGEVTALLSALKDAPPVVGAAVTLLLVLGQRSAETVEGMRWKDLDLAADIPAWKVPGRFRKGGRIHVVPLPPLAVRTIEGLRPLTGEKDRVLDGISEANAERDWWGSIRERSMAAFEMERFSKHDLRRTCATGCAKLGASPFIVSCILGHATQPGVQVTQIYNRYSHTPEMASALNAWAARVEELASGEERRAEVRAFARGRA
jgi:integrase